MANTSLPRLNADGLLPVGIHTTNLTAFKERFVFGFKKSKTRQDIFDGYLRLMQEILPLNLSGWQWLDGSYVTDTEDPNDLDVVTFLIGDELDDLSAEEQTTLMTFLWGEQKTIPMYSCDTKIIIVRAANHPEYHEYINLENDKIRSFGRTNPVKTGREIPKGFVRVDLPHNQNPTFQNELFGTSIMVDTPIKEPQQPREPDIEWSAADLEESLAVCISARQRLEEAGSTKFSSRIQIMSLQKEEVWLKQRVAAARLLESEYDAEIVIDGSPVVDHQVDASFYAKIIQLLQNLVTGLSIGDVPTRLRLAPSLPSSFKTPFVLVDDSVPAAQSDQLEFKEGFDLPKLASVSGADILINILDEQATKLSITQALDTKANKVSYAKMVKLIGAKNATVYLRTKHNPIGAKITAATAEERANWLQEMTWKVETIIVEGELREAGLDTGRFKIDVGTETYNGKARKAMADMFFGFRMGAKVKATLEKTTKNHIELDQPLVSYSLQNLEDATTLTETSSNKAEPAFEF